MHEESGIVLTARYHPEADGRTPESGDVSWKAKIPLEGGRYLLLRLGKRDRDILFGMMIADCSDNNEPEPGEVA